MKGKVIGISEPGGEVPRIKAALQGVGIDPGKDVCMIPIGEGSPATFNAMKTGQVDAYASSSWPAFPCAISPRPRTRDVIRLPGYADKVFEVREVLGVTH